MRLSNEKNKEKKLLTVRVGLFSLREKAPTKIKLKKIAIPRNFDRISQNAKRVQRVDDYEDQDSYSDEMVLSVESEGTQKTMPYYMDGWIIGFRFKTMIDTGSHVMIIAVDEKKRKLCLKKIFKLDRWLKERSMCISKPNP